MSKASNESGRSSAGGRKTFIGPRLRQLRRERGQTQAEMAKLLGVSPAYVNLLENNQRSLSVQVLLRVSEAYGVDWRHVVEDDAPSAVADLRAALQDPMFAPERPDLQELRAALDHCPRLARSFLRLHKSYRVLTEKTLALGEAAAATADSVMETTPDSAAHELFRRSQNHFDAIERAAEAFRGADPVEVDAFYVFLKERLRSEFGVAVRPTSLSDMPHTLRDYDAAAGEIRLSDALDYPNKLFQLAHVAGLLAASDLFDAIIEAAGGVDNRAAARCRVELANYFAAAVLMPYAAIHRAALETRYDIDLIACRFGVSFEQVCQRLTTLQRDGAQGAPFFFLRVDKAGNVTKRFSATSFHLAEYGGACPRWDVHLSFRTPGRILPQFVETPDGGRYFTINRTVDRPALGRHAHDNRLAVTLGCAIAHAGEVCYAAEYQLDEPGLFTPIGINCRLCPRAQCAQRAHQPVHLELPIDERRRGETRFDS